MNDSKKERFLTVVLWVLPLVFMAGVFFQSSSNGEEDLFSLNNKFDAHRLSDGHPVAETKLSQVMTQQSVMFVEQRKMGEKQQVMAIQLASICQATGASCGR
jgi:hypothetical protein